MRKKSKDINIKLSISNKLLYSIISVFIIVAIGAVAYAAGGTGTTPNPGHSADQISGVCKTDGTGCPSLGGNDARIKESMKEMYVQATTNKLCYKYGSTGCSTQPASCPITTTNEIPVDHATVGTCTSECQDTIACDGTTVPNCNGGNFVYFNKGVVISSTDCKCSLTSAQSYTKEIAGSGTQERCI